MGIDGADSKGKANDKEVCGDAAAVRQRRCEALRRRAAAVQEHLDKILSRWRRNGYRPAVRGAACTQGLGDDP